jgi:ATP-dependent DNA helicase RecG
MNLPSNEEILDILDRLDFASADELESLVIEFKPWTNAKESRREAVEYAVCMANSEGGVIIFGVSDKVKGRPSAIHGAEKYNLDQWRRDIFADIKPDLQLEVEELVVPEGTGRLLVVRVPKGDPGKVYGTTQGLYKKRVGKNCMPMDPVSYLKARIASAALDWSSETAETAVGDDLDPLEIARARNILRANRPGSDLIKSSDEELLTGLGALRKGRVTRAGLLLFGREDRLAEMIPQAVVHYTLHSTETRVTRNDLWRYGLLKTLELIEQIFSGPRNPEQELSAGLFKLRIPSFPLEAVREAVLNAITHRDYSEPGKILIRHTERELVISSPGGFPPGITTSNILRHEPVARNPALANALLKLGLVESSGVGRKRIFIPLLSYGKRMPEYETDGRQVVLRIYDGSYDDRTAKLVANWNREGREIGLDGLLVLTYLKKNKFIDTTTGSILLQTSHDEARSILDQLAQPRTGILEQKGRTKAATYHLAKGVAKDLLGKAAYTKTRGIDPIRYAEMIKIFVEHHGSISPQECRELLGLGESQTARVEVSKLLAKLSKPEGFLRREGKPPKVIYYPVDGNVSKGVRKRGSETS